MPNCEVCGKGMLARKKRSVFCSPKCSNQALHDRYRAANPTPTTLSTCMTGARHELLVCADLMGKGFAVYRAVAPVGCDLAVLRDGKLLRVEVTTGAIRITAEGKRSIYHPQKDMETFDILAVVTRDGTIYYQANAKGTYGLLEDLGVEQMG